MPLISLIYTNLFTSRDAPGSSPASSRSTIPQGITLRRAEQQDSRAIRRLVWQVHINPTGLDWHRFLVAVDDRGGLAGCGQVKPHSDNSRELASIAVQPAWRGRGIASAVIRRLLAENSPPLYLVCRSSLVSFYSRFGFHSVPDAGILPPHFRSMLRLFHLAQRLPGRRTGGVVMFWGGGI